MIVVNSIIYGSKTYTVVKYGIMWNEKLIDMGGGLHRCKKGELNSACVCRYVYTVQLCRSFYLDFENKDILILIK